MNIHLFLFVFLLSFIQMTFQIFIQIHAPLFKHRLLQLSEDTAAEYTLFTLIHLL